MRSRAAKALVLIFALASCKDVAAPDDKQTPNPPPVTPPAPPPEQPPAPPPTTAPPQTGPRSWPVVSYVAPPPEGKLPWPQHDPAFNQSAYDAMMGQLSLVNNFGIYQGGTDATSIYLHDALDIVLPNETKIYAVSAGVVRLIEQQTENYKSIIISDLNDPTVGWGYTHVDSFKVAIGDTVQRGTYIARVRFAGIEHIHLSRIHVGASAWWNDWISVPRSQPDRYFAYEDAEPPVFDTQFRYFRNESDQAFAAASPTVVSGDVDIVVGMRDPGKYARVTRYGGVSDRLAVTRIEYDITAPDGTVFRNQSFDLTKLQIPRPNFVPRHRIAGTIFKQYERVFPNSGTQWWQGRLSYYVITNSPAQSRVGPIDTNDSALSWRTTEVANGDYIVTVRAWDFRGNMSTRSDTVRVQN